MSSPIGGAGPRREPTSKPAKGRARAGGTPGDGPAAEPTMSEAARVAKMDAAEAKPSDELRTEKIFALRARIAAGDYAVDADEIAARLIEQL